MVDMDDVLCKFTTKVVDVWNTANPARTIKIDDVNIWNIESVIGEGGAEFLNRTMQQTNFYANLDPMEHAVEVMKYLHDEGHDVIIVTAVPKHVPGATDGKLAWIRQHLPFFNLKNFFSAHRKDLVHAHVMFDDGPHNLDAFRGVTVAMDWPWNKKSRVAYRVSDWLQFKAVIDSLNLKK